MSRKPNNFRRGGSSGGYRRFGGTGSLGNYNRSGKRNDGHGENRRSGSWGGDSFNRSYIGSSNHNNNNNNFAPISKSKLNNQEEGFQKFRDPNALEQHNSNSRSHHGLQERNGRGRDRRGGNPHFVNDIHKNDVNWYGDRRNAHLLQADEQNQGYPSSSVLQISSTSNLPQTISSVAPPPTVSTTLKNPSHDEEECNLESKKHVLNNIKQEKTEVEKDNRILKQTHKHASSSSSSSESSESEDEALPSKQPQNIIKSNTIKVKQEALGKETQKINTKQATSDSASSSEEDNKISDKTITKSNVITEKGVKIAKKQSKKKHLAEEDLICLGKLERNFVIEDDVSEETEVTSQKRSGTTKNQCLICDKQGHTAFECQMICKNCSAPYHNMKSCPKPANLSTMLQSYMEFCIGQMSQFNPEKKFTMPPNICGSESTLKISNLLLNTEQNKTVKRLRTKSDDSLKKPTKRRHRYASKSSDDEEYEKDDEENKTEAETSEPESESDSSEKETATKVKKRRTKMPSPMKTSKFHNTFLPPFSSFPAFSAAAAAYNPLLLSQLMNSGGFGAADKRIFQ